MIFLLRNKCYLATFHSIQRRELRIITRHYLIPVTYQPNPYSNVMHTNSPKTINWCVMSSRIITPRVRWGFMLQTQMFTILESHFKYFLVTQDIHASIHQMESRQKLSEPIHTSSVYERSTRTSRKFSNLIQDSPTRHYFSS
jgi:hypothetical protein